MQTMRHNNISTEEELIEVIQEVGFLPLLPCHIAGFSVEEMVDADCRYQVFDDGSWDWPMWKWKGSILSLGECTYGKFYCSKAGYLSMPWWQDMMNYRRSIVAAPAEDSIEGVILETLQAGGSMITRDLRAACEFTGKNMRSKFDGYVTRLQMQCRIVTEDFVYPRDRHGKEYGWGLALLTTPEELLGRELCTPPCNADGNPRTPQESFDKMKEHLARVIPSANDKQLTKLLAYK